MPRETTNTYADLMISAPNAGQVGGVLFWDLAVANVIPAKFQRKFAFYSLE
jgi:hypothetical protein